MIIKNALVYTPYQGFINRDICIDGERFATQSDDMTIIDGSDCYLIPGLIDIHFHGCAGYDFCDATEQALTAIGSYELAHGITSICPASMTLSEETLTNVCANAANYAKAQDITKTSRLCGVNLEGPFISEEKKGAQNPAYIHSADVGMVERLQAAANGLVKLITIAPEESGAMEFIEEMSAKLHISLGHTTCDYSTAAKAFASGADHLTHLYNAMPPLSHRAPGPIGAAAECGSIMAELICDGIHIHPAAVQAAFKLFGEDHIVFISDSMMATGMTDGRYALGGLPVNVKGHYATLDDGTLAGSATNLMDCMKSAVNMGIPIATAVKCATTNPARSIGIDDEYGSIADNKYADCLLLDMKTLELKSTIVHGQML